MKARNLNREKLLNAMIFFIKNTNRNKIGKMKMSKLLFALDFEHFHQTGRTVTGLTYYAWKWGPYPKDIMENMDENNFPSDLAKYIGILPKAIYNEDETGYLFKLKPNTKLNLDIFSKRELQIMGNWATIFHDASATLMSDWSHEADSPWDRVWKVEGRKFEKIDYVYALDNKSPLEKSEAQALLEEEEEYNTIFPVKNQIE